MGAEVMRQDLSQWVPPIREQKKGHRKMSPQVLRCRCVVSRRAGKTGMDRDNEIDLQLVKQSDPIREEGIDCGIDGTGPLVYEAVGVIDHDHWPHLVVTQHLEDGLQVGSSLRRVLSESALFVGIFQRPLISDSEELRS